MFSVENECIKRAYVEIIVCFYSPLRRMTSDYKSKENKSYKLQPIPPCKRISGHCQDGGNIGLLKLDLKFAP